MNAKDIPRSNSVQRKVNEIRKKFLDKQLLDGRSGIYVINNRQNGHKYVGQSCNLKDRKTGHFLDLKNNRHGNPYLQNAYNLYGVKAFQFFVIEYVPNLTEIDEREQYWIERLKPEYNIIQNVFEGFHSAVYIDPELYRKDGETFDRPKWHLWVYGGSKNPITEIRYKTT